MSEIRINQGLDPVFNRDTEAYKQDLTTVASGVVRYEIVSGETGAFIEEATTNLLTTPTSPAAQDLTVTEGNDYTLSFSPSSGTVLVEHKLVETTTADFGTGTLTNTSASGNTLTIAAKADPTFVRATVANKKDGSQVTSGTVRYENVVDAIVIDTKTELDRGTFAGVNSTLNFLTANQSNIETDTVGFNATGATAISRSSNWAWQGTYSLKVDNATSSSACARIDAFSLKAGTYIFSAYIYNPGSGEIIVTVHTVLNTQTASSFTIPASGSVRIYRGETIAADTVAASYVRLFEATGQTFYVDGLQLELGSTMSSWTVGGTSSIGFNTAPVFSRASKAYIDAAPIGSNVARFSGDVLEYGTTNLLTANQSNAETDTTGVSASGGSAAISKSSAWAWQGTSSFKIDNATSASVFAGPNAITILTGIKYGISAYVYNPGVSSITVHVGLAGVDSASLTLAAGASGRISVVYLSDFTSGSTTLRFWESVSGQSFHIDGIQLETAPAVTAWIVGGSSRATTYNKVAVLIEESTTNLAQYSEQFDNAYWGKTEGTITANATIAPDGTLTADKFVESANSNYHELYKTVLTISQPGTCSVHAKAAERTRFGLGYGNAGTDGCIFDLITGTIVQTAGAGTVGAIKYVGNGWYRCSVSKASAANATWDIMVVNTGTTTIYTGDVTKGIYFWGAQAEVKAYPTTYVPTPGAATATRALDSLTVSNAQNIISPTQGSAIIKFYVDGDLSTAPSAATHMLLDTPGSVGTNRFALYRTASTWVCYVGGVGAMTYTGTPASGWHAWAVRWASSGSVMYLDGALATTTGTAAIGTTAFTTLYIGNNNSSSAAINNLIGELQLFSDTLSNADMVTYSATGAVIPMTATTTYKMSFTDNLNFGASGVYTSEWFNVGVSGAVYSAPSISQTLPAGTTILTEYRTTDSDTQASPSSWSTTAGTGKYIQYRHTLVAVESTSSLPVVTSTTINPTSLGKAITIEESAVNLFVTPGTPAAQDVTVTAAGDYALSFTGTSSSSGSVLMEHKLVETTTADFGTGTLTNVTAASNALSIVPKADPTFVRATAATKRDGTSVTSGTVRYEDVIRQNNLTTQKDFDSCTKTGPVATSPAGNCSLGIIFDGFDADSSAGYTNSNAASLTPTFNTANSRLQLIITSTFGTYTYNNFSAKNAAVEVVGSQFAEAAILLRYQDDSNFYALYVNDDTYDGVNNIAIRKRVAGVNSTVVGYSNITITRGTQYTIRFEVVDAVLKAYVDGTLVLSATDSSLTAAGKVGFYQNTGTSSYYQSFMIDQATPLFARNSVATNEAAVSIAANLPRYASGKNLLTKNQSDIEVNTTGFGGNGGTETITRSTADFWQGTACLSVVTPGSGSNEGIYARTIGSTIGLPIVLPLSSAITVSAYVKGAGTLIIGSQVYYQDGTSTSTNSSPFTANSTWTRQNVSMTSSASKRIKYVVLTITTNSAQAVTFLVDGVQIEATALTSWQVGGDNAIMCEEGTINMVTSGRENFTTGWAGASGASGVVTSGQTDPFGGTSAYRITTTTGSVANKWFVAMSGTYTNALKYSASVWMKVNTAEPVKLNCNLTGLSSSFYTSSDGWKLIKLENATGNGASVPSIYFDAVAASGELDFTVMWPQIEQKAYCTSYVAPAVTRVGETIALSKFPFTTTASGAIIISAYFSGDLVTGTAIATHDLLYLGDVGGLNTIRIVRAGNYLSARTNAGGATSDASWASATLAEGWHKVGIRWAASRLSLYMDGSERASVTSSVNVPAAPPTTYLWIGSSGAAGISAWNGAIDDFSMFENYPTDAEMVSYTTL